MQLLYTRRRKNQRTPREWDPVSASKSLYCTVYTVSISEQSCHCSTGDSSTTTVLIVRTPLALRRFHMTLFVAAFDFLDSSVLPPMTRGFLRRLPCTCCRLALSLGMKFWEISFNATPPHWASAAFDETEQSQTILHPAIQDKSAFPWRVFTNLVPFSKPFLKRGLCVSMENI